MANVLGVPIDGKGVLSIAKRKCVKVKILGIIAHKIMHEPMQKGLKVEDSFVRIGCGQ